MTDYPLAVLHRMHRQLLESMGCRGDRLVVEIEVRWLFEADAWRPSTVRVASALPRRDGTASALTATHVLTSAEAGAFLAAFPEAAEPPAARIHLTIEGDPK